MDSSALVAALRPVLEAEPDVLVAALFGSAARDRLGPESDVDVYLRTARAADWDLRRIGTLAGALERVVRREVDIVVEDPDRTSVILRLEVARHGKLVFERYAGAWTTLRANAMVAHADMEPFMARCGEGVRRRVRGLANG